MDEFTLRQSLSDIPLGGLRFYPQIGSTNDEALAWAAAGAPDLALVCAEEQTSGRGRGSRSWFSPPGACLAFSLILRPLPGEEQSIPRFSALGALCVCEALGSLGLEPEVKWPNDVLIDRRKVCGILAESVWEGERVQSIVVGIGVNVSAGSVPPAEGLNFPATALENEAARLNLINPAQLLDRPSLLHQILQALLYWRGLVGTDIFLHAWATKLAFLGEQVEVWSSDQERIRGTLEGLESDGSLRLLTQQGKALKVHFGEVHLQPVV